MSVPAYNTIFKGTPLTQSTGTTNYSISTTGVIITDFLIAVISTMNPGDSITAVPTGWNLLGSCVDSTNAESVFIYYKQCDANDVGNKTYTWSIYSMSTGGILTGGIIKVTNPSGYTVDSISSSVDTPMGTTESLSLPASPTVPSGIYSVFLSVLKSIGSGIGYPIVDSIPSGTTQRALETLGMINVHYREVLYCDTVNGVSASQVLAFHVPSGNTGAMAIRLNLKAAVTAPPAPTNPTISNVQTNQITIGWGASTGADNYHIDRSLDGNTWTVNYATVTGTSYNDTGVSTDTRYYYRIRAYNAGGYSAYTAVVNSYTLPSQPTLDVLLVSDSSVQLPISLNNATLTVMDIFRSVNNVDYTAIATGIPPATSYTDNTVLQNTQYYYMIRVYNTAGGSAYSNARLCKTHLAVPTISTGNVAEDGILLSIVPNSVATDMTIYRSLDNATWIQVYTGELLNIWYNSPLNPDTRYYYRVLTRTADNVSNDYGYCSSYTLPEVPTVSIGEITRTTINLVINPNNAILTGMNILRSTDGVNFTTIENEIPVANSYMDMGLPANTHFWYQVQVVDSAGASAASIPVDGTTLDYPPAVPTDLACTPDGNSAIQLSWANSGLGGAYTSIHVDRKSAGSEWIVDYRVLSATFESYTDTGLQPNTHYYYRIRAYNSGGYSEYTASVDTYTLPANPLPFTAKPHGFTAILLSWSYSGNPANFILERYKNGVKVKTINIASTARSYIDTGLLPWGKYDYKLYAVNTVRVEWKSSGVNSSTNTMGLAAQRHISLRR